MHITDPIADMLTRIRNANNAKHDTVDIPASNMKKAIAQRAKDKGIDTVVFDRGGYLYHGRVKALAEGARKAGLEF